MVALDTLREGTEGQGDRDLEDQLNADATKRFFSLLIRSKVLCGPRQTGDATAHLSIKQFIPEKVFKRFIHHDDMTCVRVGFANGAVLQVHTALGNHYSVSRERLQRT